MRLVCGMGGCPFLMRLVCGMGGCPYEAGGFIRNLGVGGSENVKHPQQQYISPIPPVYLSVYPNGTGMLLMPMVKYLCLFSLMYHVLKVVRSLQMC